MLLKRRLSNRDDATMTTVTGVTMISADLRGQLCVERRTEVPDGTIGRIAPPTKLTALRQHHRVCTSGSMDNPSWRHRGRWH